MNIETNLSNQIYNILKDRIINLELKLGQRINMNELAKEFEVSQTPIRDVLNKLIKDGLIIIIPRRGYHVIKPSVRDMEEIYDLRKMFEPYALEIGIKNININKLKTLKQETENLQLESNKKKKRERFNKTDNELHLLIIKSSLNKKLYEMYSNIYNFIKISQRMDPDFEGCLKCHIVLINYILKKDVKRAKRILVFHINEAKKCGIKQLEMKNFDKK